MKVSTAYSCIKGFELTPQQFVKLVERLNDDVRAITMPNAVEDDYHNELAIEQRLIANYFTLPFGNKKSITARQ